MSCVSFASWHFLNADQNTCFFLNWSKYGTFLLIFRKVCWRTFGMEGGLVLLFRKSLPTEHLSFYLGCLQAVPSSKCMVVLWGTFVCILCALMPKASMWLPVLNIQEDISAIGWLVWWLLTVPIFSPLNVWSVPAATCDIYQFCIQDQDNEL